MSTGYWVFDWVANTAIALTLIAGMLLLADYAEEELDEWRAKRAKRRRRPPFKYRTPMHVKGEPTVRLPIPQIGAGR